MGPSTGKKKLAVYYVDEPQEPRALQKITRRLCEGESPKIHL